MIHAGGVSGPMVLAEEPAKVIDINVGGSLNLLQACLETSVSTFVYCSSVSALGDFYEPNPFGADFPLHPINTYGCSKAAMEMVLRGLWKRVPLDLCSLRFTSVYGPGRRTSLIIDEIVDAALQHQPVAVEPTSDWPFIFIDDAADAAVAACFSQRRRQLHYFISYPEQVSLSKSSMPPRRAERARTSASMPRGRRSGEARSTSDRRDAISGSLPRWTTGPASRQ